MKKLLWIIVLSLCCACDDPSLDTDDDVTTPIEPIIELTQLASIDIATNTPSNITDSYQFTYDTKNLITQINTTLPQQQLIGLSYTAANRLQETLTTSSTGDITTKTVTNDIDNTGQDIILLSYTDLSNQVIEQRLYTDAQNRINRSVITRTDPATGTTIFISEEQLEYTQNFNVSRINRVNESGLIIAHTDFTYNFNNNPFQDMDDIVRYDLFDAFNPYSRNLPATREDYSVSLSNGTTLDRSITYTYQLNSDGFPDQRELTITQMGNSITYFEFFNYRL